MYDVVQPENASLPPRVSYSQMSKYNQCGLRYYFSYVTAWREPQTQALVAGVIAHEVIEHLYRLPQEERTRETAMALIREHGPRMLKLPDYQPFANDSEMKLKVNQAVENLFEIELPHELVVQPEHLEMELDVEINGVNFFGKVDRFTQDGVVRVTDYKTGKASKGNPLQKKQDRYLEAKFDQPYLYALAFKTLHDIEIEEVELIFLNAKFSEVRSVDSGNTQRLGEDLALMRAGSINDLAQSAWLAKWSPLCSYCPFQQACPLVTPDAPTPGTAESDAILRSNGLFQK